jgi:hypothetical protein
MAKYRRKENGRLIREAMLANGLTIAELAKETETLVGVRPVGEALVGMLVSEESWGRDTTTELSARSIAAALGKPVEELFDKVAPTSTLTALAGGRIVGTLTPGDTPGEWKIDAELIA